MTHVRATYYLEFGGGSARLVDAVKEFFAWAAMGTSAILPYIEQDRQRMLRGQIVNVTPDVSNASSALVTYEFDDSTFEEADLALLLSYLLYSSIQGSTKQLRLVDLELPSWLVDQFPGPSIGGHGLREMLNVRHRPLFGVILKPRQGLPPNLAASIAAAAIDGGADYVVDDEVMVDHPSCRLLERAAAVIPAMDVAAARTHRQVMYIVNVTSSQKKIRDWHVQLRAMLTERITIGLMVNGITMGFPAISDVREMAPDWPLIANTVGSGMLVLAPSFNVSEHILVQLSRLSGADAVYAVRHAASYAFDPSKVDTILTRLKTGPGKHRPALPIYAGSISLGPILRGELPVDPDFMVQAGTSVCGFGVPGMPFPRNISTATAIIMDVLEKVYVKGIPINQVSEDLATTYSRRGRISYLKALGLDSWDIR